VKKLIEEGKRAARAGAPEAPQEEKPEAGEPAPGRMVEEEPRPSEG
jgi:hypothetical protein